MPAKAFSRRTFLAAASAAVVGCATNVAGRAKAPRPNIILVMADDQGWGDTGYNGHPILKTPELDRMAREGVRMDRFYAAAPVCSPTRASCLTGRHPYRMGITGANTGHLPREEEHLAKILKKHGYTTGHFGKWHLGTLSRTVKDSNRGGKPENFEHYAPPWDRDFDVCFSTEAKVPTYDPMVDPETGGEYGTYYWTPIDKIVDENLDGDDSRVIMDRAIPFIQKAAERGEPFFAVIWFHSPHKPLVGTREYDAMYGDGSEYYGCITAIDTQVGRLRRELDSIGIAEDTMLWYCSDNGPENGTPGATGPFRERKRSLHEGGVRVPGIVVWPNGLEGGNAIDTPLCTSDYLPTICDALNIDSPDVPLDGISALPYLKGKRTKRERPIAFQSHGAMALHDNQWKIIRKNDEAPWELYDIENDPGEAHELSTEHPAIVAKLSAHVLTWREEVHASSQGQDYR